MNARELIRHAQQQAPHCGVRARLAGRRSGVLSLAGTALIGLSLVRGPVGELSDPGAYVCVTVGVYLGGAASSA